MTGMLLPFDRIFGEKESSLGKIRLQGNITTELVSASHSHTNTSKEDHTKSYCYKYIYV